MKCVEGDVECKLITKLLSYMQFACGNREKGCNMMLDLANYHEHQKECPNNSIECVCLIEFDNINSLKNHYHIHEWFEVNCYETLEIKVDAMIDNSLQKFNIHESTTGDLFVLIFEDSKLFVRHCWGNPRSYVLLMEDPQEKNRWNFSGKTTAINNCSKPLEGLHIPKSTFPQNEPFTCQFTLFEKSETQLKSTICKVDELECLQCFVNPATPPVYHCTSVHRHLICTHCKAGLDEAGYDERCLFCMNEHVMVICEGGSNILLNCCYECLNNEHGCLAVLPTVLDLHNVRRVVSSAQCVIMDVRIHFQTHDLKIIEFEIVNEMTITRGRHLVQEVNTKTYFVLIYVDDKLCLQHMKWDNSREYWLRYSEMEKEWNFMGNTSKLEPCPKFSANYFIVPYSISKLAVAVKVSDN